MFTLATGSLLALALPQLPVQSFEAKAATKNTGGSSGAIHVRVAGQDECARCSPSTLAERLHVEPRQPIAKRSAAELVALRSNDADLAVDVNEMTWFVKFVDQARVRRTDGAAQLTAHTGDVQVLNELLEEYGIELDPALNADPSAIADLEERAMRRTLRAQPDLAGMYYCRGTLQDARTFLEFGQRLEALNIVEFVSVESDVQKAPSEDEKTFDLTPIQSFLYERDDGVGAPFAWEMGIFGQGVRVTDVETNFMSTHEDLQDADIQIEPGAELPWRLHDHGTATMGVLVGSHNDFGINGLAPRANPFFYPTDDPVGENRRPTAVSNAILHSSFGDIVIYESQAYRKLSKKNSKGKDYEFTPLEYLAPFWTFTSTATDAGVVIVAAAGNGGADLDGDPYKSYRARGDSGAIIVGAGSADHRHMRLSFSNYGSRVDVQAWGHHVVTAGYGDLRKEDDDPSRSYTDEYSGTSSATAIVGGVVTLVQSYARERLGRALSPNEMRGLLKRTGVAQTGTAHIGPMVSVRGAIESLAETEYEAPVVDLKIKDLTALSRSHQNAEQQSDHLSRISVDAVDNSHVQEVYLEINGEKVGDADSEEPYIFDIELGAEEYDVRAVAVDRFGNKGTSRTIHINAQGQPSGDTSDAEQQDNQAANDDVSSADSLDAADHPAADANPSSDGTQDKQSTGCTAAPSNRALWLGMVLLPLVGRRRRR